MIVEKREINIPLFANTSVHQRGVGRVGRKWEMTFVGPAKLLPNSNEVARWSTEFSMRQND